LGEGSSRYKVIVTETPQHFVHPSNPPHLRPQQHGLGGGQSTLDAVEHSLHNRFDSLTRAGARLPPLLQQQHPSSSAQPASSSPSFRQDFYLSPSPQPASSSRLATSASRSPAAKLQSAAAALAEIKRSGDAAALSERWPLLRDVLI
jgi:hypothetical protein